MNVPCAESGHRAFQAETGSGGERVRVCVCARLLACLFPPAAAACWGDPLGKNHMSEPGPPTQTEYALRRRLPRRLPRRRSDIYINMKTDFKAQLSRCQKLLAPGSGCPEICIHGLGLAINRAINIALQLEATGSGSLCLAANTSTVELADVAEPEGDSDEPLARTRNNSAIHIRVCRVAPE